MQKRMKEHTLTKEEIKSMLSKSETGTIATVNEDGSPYVAPVHFAYLDNSIYFHGLPRGQKIENIARNGAVCFNTFCLQDYIMPKNDIPCDVNTMYESVTIKGNAKVLTDIDEKMKALLEIVKKYTPTLAKNTIPPQMANATAVVKIEISEITGKYYK